MVEVAASVAGQASTVGRVMKLKASYNFPPEWDWFDKPSLENGSISNLVAHEIEQPQLYLRDAVAPDGWSLRSLQPKKQKFGL